MCPAKAAGKKTARAPHRTSSALPTTTELYTQITGLASPSTHDPKDHGHLDHHLQRQTLHPAPAPEPAHTRDQPDNHTQNSTSSITRNATAPPPHTNTTRPHHQQPQTPPPPEPHPTRLTGKKRSREQHDQEQQRTTRRRDQPQHHDRHRVRRKLRTGDDGKTPSSSPLEGSSNDDCAIHTN